MFFGCEGFWPTVSLRFQCRGGVADSDIRVGSVTFVSRTGTGCVTGPWPRRLRREADRKTKWVSVADVEGSEPPGLRGAHDGDDDTDVEPTRESCSGPAVLG